MRGVLFRLRKEVANARSTNTDEHFGEFRTGNTEEWHSSFAGDGASHEGFTSARLASKENTARDFGAEFFVLFRLFQEINNFLEILFRSFVPGNIFEEDFFLSGP